MSEGPQVLCNVHDVGAEHDGPGGALWRLEIADRHLDSNVVRLAAGRRIAPHTGPDLDVLMLVLAGHGQVIGAQGAVPAEPGSLLWLPRRSERSIVAGADGLCYLTVHPHRPGLTIGAPRS